MDNDYFSLLVTRKCVNIGRFVDYLRSFNTKFPTYDDYIEYEFALGIFSRTLSNEKLDEFEFKYLCSYISLRNCL